MHAPANISHNSYIQRELIVAGVVNVLLGVLATYAFVPNNVPIPLWGGQGIAVDLVPTVFMLTLIGNTVITFVTRHRLRTGKVTPILRARCGWLARHLPRRPAPRILLLAFAATAVVVPVSVLGFWLSGVEAMRFDHYLLFKACYGPLVGALSAKAAVEAALTKDGARP